MHKPVLIPYRYLADRVTTVFVFRLWDDRSEFLRTLVCNENEYWANAYTRIVCSPAPTNAHAYEIE